MTTLRHLHDQLSTLAQEGGGARLYFYASSPSGRLRHGYFLVLDRERCQLNFEGMDSEDALAELPRLDYVKVDRLALHGSTTASTQGEQLEIHHVLNMIDPDIHEHAIAKAAPEVAKTEVIKAVETTSNTLMDAPTPSGNVNLLYLRLRDMAVEALTPFLGNGSAKRVDAIATRVPPVRQPREFLMECQSAATMIVGARKAEEAFRPLFAKLDD